MFQSYVDGCTYKMTYETPDEIKIIKSDDVFDYIYNVKELIIECLIKEKLY